MGGVNWKAHRTTGSIQSFQSLICLIDGDCIHKREW